MNPHVEAQGPANKAPGKTAVYFNPRGLLRCQFLNLQIGSKLFGN
jgi:hypothetical protein